MERGFRYEFVVCFTLFPYTVYPAPVRRYVNAFRHFWCWKWFRTPLGLPLLYAYTVNRIYYYCHVLLVSVSRSRGHVVAFSCARIISIFFAVVFPGPAAACWTCNVCGKWYKHRESLRRHTREECGKMPRHQCYVCHLYFYHKHNMKTHCFSKHGVLIRWTYVVEPPKRACTGRGSGPGVLTPLQTKKTAILFL